MLSALTLMLIPLLMLMLLCGCGVCRCGARCVGDASVPVPHAALPMHTERACNTHSP